MSIFPWLLLISVIGMPLSGLVAWAWTADKNAKGALMLSTLFAVVGVVGAAGFLRAPSAISLAALPWASSLIAVDPLSALFFLFLSVTAALVSIFAIPYLARESAHYHPRMTVLKTTLFLFGMQGVLLAASPMVFLFFWETMSLASFFLVMSDRSASSVKAALLYFIMTHLGASALLAGFGVLGLGDLTLTLSDVAVASSTLSPGMLLFASLLLLFGFASKAGLVPFHVWLPEAHPAAPSHVSALMSGTMLSMAVYGLLRILTDVLPTVSIVVASAVLILGLLSAVYGVLYASVESDLKRMLAYSSIENMGLVFSAIGLGLFGRLWGFPDFAVVCFLAALIINGAHTLFKAGLFLMAGTLVSSVHSHNLEKMGGLAARMPMTGASALLLILGAAALPPFAAFTGEWSLIQAILSILPSLEPMARIILLVALSLLTFTGGMAVFAMGKLFGIAFLAAPRTPEAEHAQEAPATMWVPVFLFAIAGLFAGLVMPWILLTTPTLHLSIANSTLNPIAIFLGLLVFFLIAFLLRRALSSRTLERPYHTWDCGQPITPGMEYTATAFSGPVRFLFRNFLRTRNITTATPIVASNPWIATRTFTLDIRSFWYELFYLPLARGITFLSHTVRRVHSGVIQWYIALIFLALALTLLIAL